ncbi:hypothetical protein NKH47_17695 [Mesorhizobium sp. M1060]|uniref:hypothetical protein n=1 Tax=unclassified Mesorhizobium TaxID=325217 RepID=UPI0003CE9D39|nr:MULTISPECIES: hypothetical protein [unclassified Mesorhizobium]ESX13497.1 hypothetical protein X768_04465 [Mesorhizobium sp. LSJC265A00]ESX31935.1 hypothetical protein X765_03625 [Mesorhizobium sp. LSHC440B00]ESX44293.1 hypothetical protein X764_03815 [Mesorhizobium sp. LSHC440A00]WJI59277.1 hypothetical protein NLY33_11445 [Mesorhizobium sp. C432A]
MKRMEKAPFVPTEIRIATVRAKDGVLGVLSIQTTEGRLDIALDRTTADAIVDAISSIRSKLDSLDSSLL